MKTTLKRGVSSNGTANGVAALPPTPFTQVTRYGPPRRHPLRLVGRIVLWLFAVLFVVVGGVADGFFLYYVDYPLAAAQPKTAAEKAAQRALDEVPPANHPATLIVIGYDKRYGAERTTVKDSRSDTIMLVRADPGQKTISMLSFPRDLRVELAGCKNHPPRVAKINEAFTDCGPRGTIETVRKLTGIPINYYATVDFRSFISVVNDVGGIYMDVDRRYFNNNRSGGESYSAINLQPGYQRLNGGNALAFVRYRHTDSDLYRNARQQEFVKAFKHQVSGLSGALRLRGIVRTIAENVTIAGGGRKELGAETLLSYAKLLYQLPSGNLFQPRLESLGEDNVTFSLSASEQEVQRVVDGFLRPDPDAATKASAVAMGRKPKPKTGKGPPPGSVTVEVLNGNGVAGAADDAAYLLGQRGYTAANGGNATTQDVFETQIFFDPSSSDGEAAARDMAKLFGDAEVLAAAPDAGLETTLLVVVGKTFQSTLAPVPKDTTPKYSPPKVKNDPAAVSPLAKRAQRAVDFPVLVPTVQEQSSNVSTLAPMRVYRLHGEGAVRFVFNGPFESDYWGVQESGWTDAPILDGPTLTRRIAGREYRLYFNGAKLHTVAFEENGAAYWVTNTLLDALSNETMLAIAKGLKPLRAR